MHHIQVGPTRVNPIQDSNGSCPSAKHISTSIEDGENELVQRSPPNARQILVVRHRAHINGSLVLFAAMVSKLLVRKKWPSPNCLGEEGR